MKTFFKIVLGILLLLVILVAGFLYMFDANDYKKELTSVAEKMTGRPISIGGNIDMSLYPFIGIKVDDVTVENPPGFTGSEFATIDQLDVKIEIIPLLQNRIYVETLVLKGLNVNFEKNTSGETNWSDITKAQDSDSAQSEFGLDGLVVGGIEVTDASLGWLDANNGKQFKISKMKLATDAVIKGEPLPISFNAYIQSNQPEWQGSVLAKTSLQFSDDSPVIKANKLKLVLKFLLPASDIEKINFAMIADSEINVQTQKAKMSNARLSILGLVMTGELNVNNLFSVPAIKGPLKVKTFEAQALAEKLKVDLPRMANEQSLKKVSLKTLFSTDFSSIRFDNIVARVDESGVKGYIHVTDIQPSSVKYDLEIDGIKLDDYNIVENDETGDGVSLPLDFIRTSTVEGNLKMGVASLNEVEFDDVRLMTVIRGGVVDIAPVSMMVGASEVKATMQLDARKTPLAVLDVTANNIDAADSINPLLVTVMGGRAINVEGMVNAEAHIEASGDSVEKIRASSSGTLKIQMDKTIIQGIDLDHETRSVVATYANRNNFKTRKSYVTEYEPDRKTEFDSLTATINISGRKWSNNDLLLVSEKANITGSGTIDFLKRKIDYRPTVDMNVSNAVDIRDKLRDHPMEYRTHGLFEKLSYDFNLDKYELLVGRLLLQEAKARSIKQQKQNIWQNIKSK